MLRIALVLALCTTGCKSMGHIASGLGHASSGLGHVASGLGHVASSAARVAAPLASGAARLAAPAARIAKATLPIANAVASAMINSAGDIEFGHDDTQEVAADPEYVSMAGPLIDDHDPCNACPEDSACDACVGIGGGACRYTPPGAHARCESSVAAQ